MKSKLILCLVSIIVAVFSAEIAARVLFPLPMSSNVPQTLHPVLGPIPIPFEKGTKTIPGVVSFSYSNNSMGMRDSQEYTIKTKPRVLLLGDSFVYGIGVNDDQTLACFLRTSLPQYEIINAGNPNKGTDYALRFYQSFGEELEPDIVVLCFFANDFIDNQRHWYYDDNVNPIPLPESVTRPEERKWPIRSWMVDHIRLVYLVKAVLVSRINSDLNSSLTSRYLAALRDEVKDKRFVAVYIPHGNHIEESREQKAFAEICRNTNIPALSFKTTPSDYLKEGHLSVEGNVKIADLIRSAIEDSKVAILRPSLFPRRFP